MTSRKMPRPVLGPSAFLDQSAPASRADTRKRGQAEASWFQRSVEMKVALRLRLRDGSEIVGSLEWADRHAFRVNLPEGGHRIVPKSALAHAERLVPEPAESTG
jgi:hypothetical protein